MRQISKLLLATMILCMFATPMSVFAQASVSIDHVDGLINGKIQPDIPIRLHMRWTNNTGFNIKGLTSQFRVFLSNNGELANGQFEPIVFDTLSVGFLNMFDLGFTIFHLSADGIGSDTVAFLGAGLFATGIPEGFDELMGHLTTTASADFAGDSLCLDSTSYPQYTWVWASSGGGGFIPEWSGPHCFEILPSCCVGITGNYDNSPDDAIDISDLVFIVDFVFTGGTPPICSEESDITADGEVDISDLVAIVDFIFTNGAPPPDCP